MKRTQISCSRRHTERRGATMVEFIFVVPIFFTVLFAGIEFATIGTIRSTSHNAAYEGARLLVIPGANAQNGIDEARRIMAVVGVDTLTVTTTPAVIRDDTTQITVDIEIPYAQNAVFTPWFVGNRILRSTCTLKTERYEGLTP
ncbi:MAG: pilus assembly protein [Planctomycetaceae bacterium]|nr:pilus assembly protein [Planctomycetaceae bacterium]